MTTADHDEPDPEDGDDEIITCWCGEKGTYGEMFSDPDEGCGGTGFVDCHCGGDLCVCHHHGQEIECPGCDDCPDGADDFDDSDFYDDEDSDQ